MQSKLGKADEPALLTADVDKKRETGGLGGESAVSAKRRPEQ